MSEIKVNKISPKQTCTTVTLGDSGDDFVVATGANLKTAAVKDTAGNVIVSRCGSNITIGSSGAAIALACGATQTGFGRTGTVNWDTTAKTASFTAVSGEGYFVNTTSGAITVTLPATPSAGDIVAVKDYANTADTNAITIARNGSNIDGQTENPNIANEGGSVTLVYVDATKGWLTVDAAQKSDIVFPTYIVATGGTETTCGDYKIHTFTGPGCFAVSSVSNISTNNEVSYIVVAGGGGSGHDIGGGGGAGGFREKKGASDCYTASPLEGSSPITVTATTYPLTIGGGGAGSPSGGGAPGNPSSFSTITSAGGGYGAGYFFPGTSQAGGCGGSGGGPSGTAGTAALSQPAASGNNPPTSPPQGNPSGLLSVPSYNAGGVGGGGATAAGTNVTVPASTPNPHTGGAGATTSISGSPTAYAGGGGGGAVSANDTPTAGGVGGGGAGGYFSAAPGATGTANTGGGAGGGSGGCGNSANGGSGIVIIRYKYQ
jgi:hypothetical protein